MKSINFKFEGNYEGYDMYEFTMYLFNRIIDLHLFNFDISVKNPYTQHENKQIISASSSIKFVMKIKKICKNRAAIDFLYVSNVEDENIKLYQQTDSYEKLFVNIFDYPGFDVDFFVCATGFDAFVDEGRTDKNYIGLPKILFEKMNDYWPFNLEGRNYRIIDDFLMKYVSEEVKMGRVGLEVATFKNLPLQELYYDLKEESEKNDRS